MDQQPAKRKRPSPVALMQSYLKDGPGAESTALLDTVAGGHHRRLLEPAPPISLTSPTPVSQIGTTTPESSSAVTVLSGSEQTKEPAQDPDNNPAWAGLASGQPAHEPDNDKANQPAHNPIPYPNKEPVQHPIIKPVPNPANYPVDPEMWYPFTQKQGRVLLYLIEAGGIANRQHISDDTGVNIATVKHTLRLLAKEGYISNVQLYVNHSIRGFSYNINRHMCEDYAARLTGNPINYPDNRSAHGPVNNPVRQPAHRPFGYPASSPHGAFSSSREKNLTTPQPANNPDDPLRDPELRYWQDKGVSMRQVENWALEFGMDIDLVIQSLKYCRFEMVVLNLEEEKPVENPVNWFYKVMVRSGLYPRPGKYKSLAEQRAEEMERAAREAAESRERQAVAERELAFQQQILGTPGGEAYQKLLAQIGEFTRNMGGKALEAEMRDLFFREK